MSIDLGSALPDVRAPIPGARASALCDVLARVECPALTARRRRREERSGAPHDPIVWARAHGANVLDVDGNRYVDLVGGFGAALLGHGHPDVVAAITTQAATLLHALGDVHPSAPKIELEASLAARAPWPDARVMLGLSGSDAIEGALKTAVLATKRAGVLAFDGGYHGLSHGALAACGYRASFREPFAAQLNPDVHFAPYPDTRDPGAIARALEAARVHLARGTIGAVILEPIRGRGGLAIADARAVAELHALAHAHGALLVADEIYTGLFRTGAFTWSGAHWSIAPDIVCLGKALGGGLPVSACVMRDDVAAAWGSPDGEAIHTSTFLGNPLAAAAALAVLRVLDRDETRTTLAHVSQHLHATLLAPLASDARCGVRAIDGAGLLVGLRLDGGATRALGVMRAMLERGYIVLTGGIEGDWLTLTPPMTLTDAQIAHAAETLRDVLTTVRA